MPLNHELEYFIASVPPPPPIHYSFFPLINAEDTCLEMLQEDVIDAILYAMKGFPDESQVQRNACQALKQLLSNGEC